MTAKTSSKLTLAISLVASKCAAQGANKKTAMKVYGFSLKPLLKTSIPKT
jgi:hypothetical protein